MNSKYKQEEDTLELIREADVGRVILIECFRYKRKHGQLPASVAVNIACSPIITSYIVPCPVSFFQHFAHQPPDREWLMLANERGEYVEFL